MRVATRGFTLIELLVTVAIVAVMSGVLVLAVGAGDEEQALQREVERLAARIGYACERAELSGRDLGLHLRAGGYAFSAFQLEGWQFIEDDVALKRIELPSTIELRAEDQELDDQFPTEPQFLCHASGEALPMRIEFVAGTQATRWRIDIAFDGTTTRSRRGPEDRDWQAVATKP